MAQSGIADNVFSPRDQISNLVPSKESYVGLKRGGKTVYMKDKQAFVRPRHPKRLEFAPSTVTSVQMGGTEVIHEHRIYEQNDFEKCDWITLRGTIKKTVTGTSLQTKSYLTEPSPLWVTRIEIFGNGSTTPLHTIYGDQIWFALTCLPAEKLAQLMGGNLMYMGTDFKVNNTISGSLTWANCHNQASPELGASYERPFIIPIMGSLLGQMRLRGLCGDTIFRIYWNPAMFREPVGANDDLSANPGVEGVWPARVSSPAASTWTFQNLQLCLESEEVLEADKMQVQRLFDQQIVLVKYLEPVVQQFSTTLQANVEAQLQLTAFTGDFAFLQVYIRDVANRALCSLKSLAPEFNNLVVSGTSSAPGVLPTGATAAKGLAEYTDAATTGLFSITDASVKPLFSPNGFKPWDIRYAHHAHSHVNTFHLRHPIYTINFCENPAKAMMDGEVDGYASFCAQEYIRLTPSAQFTGVDGSTAACPCRVTVVGWRIKHVEVARRTARLI